MFQEITKEEAEEKVEELIKKELDNDGYEKELEKYLSGKGYTLVDAFNLNGYDKELIKDEVMERIEKRCEERIKMNYIVK